MQRRKFPTSVPTEFAPKLVTADVMDCICAVVKDTSTLSWLPSVPYNFGDASAGTLKADEWRTMATVTKLKQWLQHTDCPAFLQECKVVSDKAFGKSDDQSSPADSAFVVVPSNLHHLVKGPRVALHAYHIMNKLTYSRSSMHLGNSLVMFYPKGNRSKRPVPGSIEHIIIYPTNKVLYTIQLQVEAQIGTTDPYAEYPHFPAQLYRNQLSDNLEVIQPDWVMLHYVRWNFSKDHCVVLNLSHTSFMTRRYALGGFASLTPLCLLIDK
ncbi:hypothetical protein CVT25_002166 [Psilocybe cyanescens]|uniref:Uncharacterized protein n=1 Tax=Psilocybe cyanescens TaxID=93625 RepID=A0A409X6L6_PSICY|nr:hypothetical protein CVT25_002166 [Psilocybe cyanescens]